VEADGMTALPAAPRTVGFGGIEAPYQSIATAVVLPQF